MVVRVQSHLGMSAADSEGQIQLSLELWQEPGVRARLKSNGPKLVLTIFIFSHVCQINTVPLTYYK